MDEKLLEIIGDFVECLDAGISNESFHLSERYAIENPERGHESILGEARAALKNAGRPYRFFDSTVKRGGGR